MFKIFKFFTKIVGTIVGIYAVFNTLVLARIGMSRIARQIRLQNEDNAGMGILERAYRADVAVLEEEEAEWTAWEEFKNNAK